ncbi:MAG: alpha-N-arabinofuranosidase [Clostridiales bacterium]|nr:alpha-N-arabinofuranosidase [Clostridiales bacterium]
MKAKLTANKKFTIGKIDNRIYGSFIEHLGRAVYNGIYEPTHPTADDMGFRQDVLELIQKLNVPIVRYPGGNFVSGYCWEDGTGDKSKRPKKIDMAWKTIESNQVGVDEFQEWAKRANTEVMMAVNLGTRGVTEAQQCVEYCNGTMDSYYANLRRENGFEEPFNFKLWCLGNEMDGPWQIGHKTADEYGRLALEAGKVMKWTDPSIELVACGSSSIGMPTYGEWEYTVLNHTYDVVDYLSLHLYFNNTKDDSAKFLGDAEYMDDFIEDIVAVCDTVKAKKHSNKTINLSFDEWNVWYRAVGDKHGDGRWTEAPHLLEEVYNFEDAVLVGTLLSSFQNHCDRVKVACLAQLVNVIAPVMTENGGKAWAQTIFYPFMYASNYGRGTTLQTIKETEYYECNGKQIPYLYGSVVDNEERGELVVFVANRSLEESMELELCLENYGNYKLVEHVELYHDDLKAINDKDEQRVLPVNREIEENSSTVSLKKHSWNMLRFKY